MESNDSNLSDEFDWSFNNAHSQEELDERVKLPTCYNQENENKENTKKQVKSAKNPRPRNDSEKSSEFPHVEFEDDVELKKYQIEVLKKAKTNGLKWSEFYELLALSSIIVLSSPCSYPAHIFTIQEWQMITCENPYTITDPVLPIEVLPFLQNVLADSLKGKTTFLSLSDSGIGQVVF
ncbi:8021_t:CDS:2 [Diversispora eburnea]|uniref:8021_t:CDS:1 n=1 Tax=Diversispora eburnea TaxID=1213867 RepID=A0A9N9G3H9_9GLOM|nr:8021_t:CDS:2 [Diversispora eburnea]